MRQSNFKAGGSGRRWQWQFWWGERTREPILTANSINPGSRGRSPDPGCKLDHPKIVRLFLAWFAYNYLRHPA
jgi:hypothetical protein